MFMHLASCLQVLSFQHRLSCLLLTRSKHNDCTCQLLQAGALLILEVC